MSDDARVKQLLAEAEKRFADTERIRAALDKEVSLLKELLLKKVSYRNRYAHPL